MPNWCDTTYTVTGEKEKVKQLYDLITKLNKQPGDLWMGDISNALGGTEDDTARGWLYEMDEQLSPDETMFHIAFQTAWGEPSNWREFVQQAADVTIYYMATEPGGGVYLTNDPDIEGKWLVEENDPYFDDPVPEDDVIEYINRQYKQYCKTIQDCIDFAKRFNNKEAYKFLYINQYTNGE